MPKINHEILSWARKNTGLSVETAARKLVIKDGKTASAADKLLAYENGTKDPSESMLFRMSKVYRQSLLTFYLERPPRRGDRGQDFRTLTGLEFMTEENFYADVLIQEIKARQSTLKESLMEEDETIPLAFIGKNTVAHGVAGILATVREVMDIDLNEYRKQVNHRGSFRFLRQRAEDSGIFVLLKGNLGSYHTNISLNVFRGFTLSDEIAPFIVINNQDNHAAWSFTLLHEIAHLVLGQTGISGSSARRVEETEKLCNDVASRFLLPEEEFETFNLSDPESGRIENDIEDYAFSRKVSSTHVAYRLYLRGDIKRDLWIRLRDFYRTQWLENEQRRKKESSNRNIRIDPQVVNRYRLGALVPLVKRLASSQILTTAKAAMLLDVHPLKVHQLFEMTNTA